MTRRTKKSPLLTVKRRKQFMTLAYVGIVAFYILYFFRPEDFIPGLQAFSLAKIAGVFTGLALVAELLSGKMRWIPEVKLLLALYVYLCLCIPTSVWVGGSFNLLFNVFSKILLIVIVTVYAVNSLKRLRIVMLVQISAMLLLALLARRQALQAGRMFGVGKMFADPNELALNLCIILPFCVALLIRGHTKLSKLSWAGAIVFLVLSIVSTASRGGFLALIAVLLTIYRQFAIRIRTAILLLVVGVCLPIAAMLVTGNTSYLDRLSTITNPDSDKTGSSQIRQRLLVRSLEITLQHPIFGVGPGQFSQLSGSWHETHNTYTGFSSEGGIPSLIIFLVLIERAFRNLRFVRSVAQGKQAWYLAGAVNSALVAYLVGAFFLSTQYWLVPYLLVAYSTALRLISAVSKNLTSTRLAVRTT
jgi:O-antigen ligase